MPDYRKAFPAVHAAYPGVKLDGGGMTPMQGRVCFHQERIFRSTGAGMREHARYVRAAQDAGLPAAIETWNDAQCELALRLIEHAARAYKMHLFRDTRTQ